MYTVIVEPSRPSAGRPPVQQGDVIQVCERGSSNVCDGDVLFVVEPRRDLFPLPEKGEICVFDPELFVVFQLCSNATYYRLRPARVVIEPDQGMI